MHDATAARSPGHGKVAANPETQSWLTLAREHANRLQQLPRMPTDPEIAPDKLKPYLGTRSPYGPRGW
jgi:hypothetical protein